MLDKMQQLALAHLRAQPGAIGPAEPAAFYREVREQRPGWLFRFLVEDNTADDDSGVRRYYTLSADPTDAEIAILEPHDLTDAVAARLPFNKPSGSQSAALGPLIKRTAPSRTKPAGPSEKIQKTTLSDFAEIATSAATWSPYFGAAHACWTRPRLRYQGQIVSATVNAYQEAINRIDEKRTVFLAFRDGEGRLPGDVPEYLSYLQNVLAQTKYCTGAVGPRAGRCALCRNEGQVYPKALFGAGLNIANLDRDGAFPGLDPCRATDTFGVCLACADLLYVYCRHVAPDFQAEVAGERALIVPALRPDVSIHAEFIQQIRDWMRQTGEGRGLRGAERSLLGMAGDARAVVSLGIVWATFGQVIDGVCGVITDVMPSRLQAIAKVNRTIESFSSPLFSDIPLPEFGYDISLLILRPLLRRPGGRAAAKSNESRRLWEVRRELAEAIYHKREVPARLMAEFLTTARWHFEEAAEGESPVYSLTREGYSEKKKTAFLTVAGWVKQVARFLHYLELVGVKMPENPPPYQPGVDWLKPYFGLESGLNSPAKAFAFLLGALYGKLLTVQGARGVNVSANALTWLRRLSLSGADLPELYVKVRGKLLEYGTEGSPQVRELNGELAELGVRLGSGIPLDETQACYFLLLGQALAVKLMPPTTKKEGDNE